MERTLKAVNGSLAVTVPSDLVRTLGWGKGDRIHFSLKGRAVHLERSTPSVPTIITVGYEGQEPSTFVDALRGDGVQVLADVRDLPLSRKKGYSKTALASRLRRSGIDYVHLKPLGAPKHVRHPYKAGGYRDSAAFFRAYDAHLASQEETMDRLKEIARDRSTAIMCVEADHSKCHRSKIAEALARDGFRVLHA